MTKLHLGCGPVKLDGWVNIDIESDAADMRLDLTQGLPFADGSVTHIFSEHVIEHFDHADALALLRECKRVLTPEGVLRISTPDLAWLVTTYLSAITTEWGNIWQPDSPCKMVNEGMRAWGHKFLFDAPELHFALRDAGFSSTVDCSWHESRDPVMSGLESRDYHNDLIIEARLGEQQECPRDGVSAPLPIKGLDPLLARQGQELQLLRAQVQEARHTLAAMGTLAAGEEQAVAEMTRLIARGEELAGKLDRAGLELAEAKAIVGQQEARLGQMEEVLAACDRRIAELAESNRSLGEALIKACESQSASERRVTTLEETLDKVRRELVDVTADRNGLYGAVADREARLAAAGERLEDRQQRVLELESIVAAQAGFVGKQNSVLEDFRRHNQRDQEIMRQQMAALRQREAKVTELASAVAEKAARTGELESLLASALSEAASWKDVYERTDAKAAGLDEELAASRRRGNELAATLDAVGRTAVGRWVLRRARSEAGDNGEDA